MKRWPLNPHACSGDEPASAMKRMTAADCCRRTIAVLYLRDQAAQGAEVARVPGILVAASAALRCLELRRLEQHCMRCEAWVVEQHPERLETQATLADVFVAIDAAPARLLR